MQKAIVGLTIATTLIGQTPTDVAPSTVTNQTATHKDACITKECVKDMIELYAERYGVSPKLALKVAKCESEFRTDVYGDGGKAYGVYQFHKPTFELFVKAYGDESMDYKNPEDSIKLAILSIAHGEGNHWTCYRKVAQGVI